MTRRCIVELAGPAGAGKTTLATALSSDSSQTRVGVEAGRLGLAVSMLSIAPALAAARLSGHGRGWTVDELRSLAYLHAWRRSLAGQRSGLFLLDHGPVFRLAALAAFGPPMTGTGAFLRWWTRTAEAWSELLDAVVWLDAPDEVLLQRIDTRERTHRIRGAELGTARTFLARYRNGYSAALELLSQHGTPVLRIDTSSSTPEEVTAAVRDSLLHQGVGWPS